MSPESPSRFSEFMAGLKAELPILLGVIPFGMIYGVLALQANIPNGTAQAMSAVVFAGSSQFLAVQLIHASAPALVIVMSIFIINLRHALYSASLAPYLGRLPLRWRALLAYLLTDEAFVVTITHYQSAEIIPYAQWFFLGAGLTLWSGWQLSTAAGIFLGAQIPAGWSLDFTLALTFIALLVPSIKDRAAAAAALSAGTVAVLGYNLPFKLGLVAAALVGISIGLWVEARWPR
jgi:4-azaleucine resistance transporter AzlC